MSHISRIKTRMVKKAHLLQALTDLGLSFEEGNLKINSFGATADVDIKVSLRFASHVGFRHSENGYEMIADWWGVKKEDREKLTHQLLQRYAYHAALEQLQEQGFSLAEEVQEKGEIRLVLRRMA